MKRKKQFESLVVSLGEAVKKRRHQMGLSQGELAEHCQMHRTYISDIENGKRNVTIGILTMLARGLNLTPLGLIEMAEELQQYRLTGR